MENLQQNYIIKTLTILLISTMAWLVTASVGAQNTPKKSHASSSATLACDPGVAATASITLFASDGTTVIGSGAVSCTGGKTHGAKDSVKISTDGEAASAFATVGACSGGGALPLTASCDGVTLTVK
jgi:hypothetical protein